MDKPGLIYAGRIVRLELKRVSLPDGRQVAIEAIHHPGGAAVLAEDEAGRICMLRQFRPVIGDWLWELPAGKLDPGEAPLATAQRELAEEAGVQAQRWRSLGAIVTTPGFCDEVIHLFAARELAAVPAQHDAHEVIQMHWWSRSEVKIHLAAGDIRDAKTLIALQRWLTEDLF